MAHVTLLAKGRKGWNTNLKVTQPRNEILRVTKEKTDVD